MSAWAQKPLLTVAGLLLLAWTLLTGGLHLDGVMDSCDALFAPVSVERRLVILKDVCHKNAAPGSFMGFPADSFCMSCHQAIKTESTHIRKLAAGAAVGESIAWERVYEIAKFVYFSHRVHINAGATCETCHGPVRERDVMTKEVEHNMKSCMACHEAQQAPNACGTCHEENF